MSVVTPIEDLTSKAEKLVNQQDFGEACRVCRRILSHHPELLAVRHLLGNSLMALGNAGEAREAMLELLDQIPNDSIALRLVGESWIRDGDHSQAREYLLRAKSSDPEDTKVDVLLAELDRLPSPDEETLNRWFSHSAQREQSESQSKPSGKGVPPVTGLPGSSHPPPPPGSLGRPTNEQDAETVVGEATPHAVDLGSAAPTPEWSPNLGWGQEGNTDEARTTAWQGASTADAAPQDFSSQDSSRINGGFAGDHVPARSYTQADPLEDLTTGAHIPKISHDPLEAEETRRREPIGPRSSDHDTHDQSRDYEVNPEDFPAPPLRSPKSPGFQIPAAAKTAGLAALVLVAATALGTSTYRWWKASRSEDEILSKIAAAANSGLRTDLEDALRYSSHVQELSTESTAALARGLAIASYEFGQDVEEAYKKAMDTLGAKADRLPDAVIAAIYQGLVQGNPGRVLPPLESFKMDPAQDPSATIAEHHRLNALLLEQQGRMAQAAASAMSAHRVDPNAPRHASLAAIFLAKRGDSPQALRLLDSVQYGDRYPAVRVARARILFSTGDAIERARAEAQAVLKTQQAQATALELAWANLILAKDALSSGENADAFARAQAASGVAQTRDIYFGLELAEAFLRAGGVEDADQVLKTLPVTAGYAARRAVVSAEVAITRGDLPAAKAALGAATRGPHVAFLHGLIAETEGRFDEAKDLYRTAAQDPNEFVRARIRWGGIELNAGNARRAANLLNEARLKAPHDPEVIPLLAKAWLQAGDVDNAKQVLESTLQIRPDAAELLTVKAHIELSQGNAEKALQTFLRVLEHRPEDPEILAAYGRAANEAGQPLEAEKAFKKAIELDPNNGSALIGLADIALQSEEIEHAQQLVDKASQVRVPPDAIDVIRTRLAVWRGAGADVVPALRSIARLTNRPEINLELGIALLQAEQDREARAVLERAQRDGNPMVQAQGALGLAWISLRSGNSGAAKRYLQTGEKLAGDLANLRLKARLAALGAALQFGRGGFTRAKEIAQESLELDRSCGLAHLALANVALERGRDPIVHLLAAVDGHLPPAEALGMLAPKLSGSRACEIARRYLRIAPQGYDARAAQEVVRACPQASVSPPGLGLSPTGSASEKRP